MTTKSITIIGAGLAGLLAGNMLRHKAVIFEKQKTLPNNHHALLRFRSGVFGTALGIPFKKVKMVKAVWGDNSNPIANELDYARKVTGQARSDRSLPVGIVKEDRYIAPPDLIPILAQACEIEFGVSMGGNYKDYVQPIISTMPMPSLMVLLDYPKRNDVEFKYMKGGVISADVANCDAYATYYLPQFQFSAYRSSITGSKLIVEISDRALSDERFIDNAFVEATCHHYASHFGIIRGEISNIQYHRMEYAKILPIDDEVRKDFMHWATDKYNIYSLGRYATWRPNLLLDDLVNDVTLISQWITKGGKYNVAKHR